MRKHWGRIILLICSAFVCVAILFISFITVFLDSDLYINNFIPKTPPDTVAPTITFIGGEEITIAKGKNYDTNTVIVDDNRSEVSFIVEGSVNSNIAGDYTLKYIATDEKGNTTEKSRIVHVIEPAGIIYLTFDDGPSAYTAKLLDVLYKYNVKVTFFVTGYGDDTLIKREHDEGHAIGLHSCSHNYAYIYSSVNNFWNDMNCVQARIENITGNRTSLMRFPGGSSNLVSTRYDHRQRIMSKLVAEATSYAYSYFDWNVDSKDAGGASSSDEVYNNVVNGLKYGESSIVLQHDVKEFSVDAVERIIQFGLEHNFVFDKLDTTSFAAHHGVNN